MKILMIISFIIGLNLFLPSKSTACPIPVFRYALEFWEPEPYRLEIFYKNSLRHGEEELIDYLIKASEGNEMKSNLITRTVNIVSSNRDIPHDILNDLSPDDFPCMMLRFPFMSGKNKPLWSAPLNRENINILLNSPVRENIANKLISDATAVWLFIESSDARKNRQALTLLNRELRRLEQTLVLPDYELWLDDYQNVSDDEVPKIKFDVVRVSYNDPHEELLVRMLLNTEHCHDNLITEPIVFPIYGRGIALWAIIGDRINEINISGAAEFLTGHCSCQLKSLNPGFDLLISKDWDNLVENIADISIANPLSGMGDFSARETEVKRQLESATLERFGTAGNKDQSRNTDPERLVYPDIFGDNREEDKDKVIGKTSEYQAEVEPEMNSEYQILADPAFSDTYYHLKTSFGGFSRNIITLVFAGVIGLILIAGIILYWKNIR